MDKTVLIGTGNPHKQAMLEDILKRSGLKAVTLKERFGSEVPEIAETGATFAENASIKARALSDHHNGYVVATDGGVTIPGLGSRWNGLYTRRFAGEEATDEDRIYALLDLAKDLSGDERHMLWQESIAIAKGGQIVSNATYDGATGSMVREYDPDKYMRGIWVCSLWYLDAYGKHFFDLTSEERDESSLSWQKIDRHIGTFFMA